MMVNIQDIQQTLSIIDEIKKGSRNFITNFYFTNEKLIEYIEQKQLLLINSDGCSIFLKENRDFYNLYFFAFDLHALTSSLQQLHTIYKTLVVDLVGKKNIIQDLIFALENQSFNEYCIFNRMVKTQYGKDNPGNDPEVVFANGNDAENIFKLIANNFDKISEHIPTYNEIVNALEKHSILVIKRKLQTVALLFFDNKGYTSTLRYWYVDPEFRGQKLGGKLIERYFYECRNITRFILWVKNDNQTAIEKYQHCGYYNDNLIDVIMVK